MNFLSKIMARRKVMLKMTLSIPKGNYINKGNQKKKEYKKWQNM